MKMHKTMQKSAQAQTQKTREHKCDIKNVNISTEQSIEHAGNALTKSAQAEPTRPEPKPESTNSR